MTIVEKRESKTVAERQALGREARKAGAAHLARRLGAGPRPARPDRPAARPGRRPHGRSRAHPLGPHVGLALCLLPRLGGADGRRPRAVPRTGLTVQLCGDAHLSNFGLYGSPERELLFDVNDFDETLPGPFEWDLKRLAASFILAGRNNGFDEDMARETALAAVRSYREHMTAYAEMHELEVWYSHIVADELLDMARGSEAAKAATRKAVDKRLKFAEKTFAKARSRDSLQAAGKLTEIVDGSRRIVDQPPLVMHLRSSTRTRRSRASSASTRRPSKTTGASSSTVSRSSIWPARWSAWAASARAASSSCCSAATSTIRSSCRSRRREPRCSSPTWAAAASPTAAIASSPGSASCRPRATSSSAG